MLPLKKKLIKEAEKKRVKLDVIQQDYLLSWILASISKNNTLSQNMLFKGGTALKKCYFGDYRFSEDLDFTAFEGLPKDTDLEHEISKAIKTASELLNKFAPIQLSYRRYEEKYPHPDGQEAFSIYAQYPWQNQPLTKVMIEITRKERVIFPGKCKEIIHTYDEEIDSKIQTYSLEEIVLEKHRAILQHIKKLHERDWGRSRSRDFYDLWQIFRSYKEKLKFKGFKNQLKKKCLDKGVTFNSASDFFDPIIVDNVKRSWEKWLGFLVINLPDIDIVLSDLKMDISNLLEQEE